MNVEANESFKDQEALLESANDSAETNMTYGDGKMPMLVVAVWVVALAGFGVYLASFLFPDLGVWGKP